MRNCAICYKEIDELDCYSVGWMPNYVFCSLEHLEQGTGRTRDQPHAFDAYLNGNGELVPWEDR